MENVQNNTINQSYYDPSDQVCSAESSETASSIEKEPPSQPSPAAREAPSAGTSALMESYSTSGAGGSRGTSDSPGAGGAPGVSEETTQDGSTLCEQRLQANRAICDAASSLISSRLGLGYLGSVLAGVVIPAACNQLADSLEYNAPLGACGDD